MSESTSLPACVQDGVHMYVRVHECLFIQGVAHPPAWGPERSSKQIHECASVGLPM